MSKRQDGKGIQTGCGQGDRTVKEDRQSVVMNTGQIRKTDSVSKKQDG